MANIFSRIEIFAYVTALQKKKVRKNLGNKIRSLRKLQKISQAQLAFESGLSRQYISYLESGVKSPTIDVLLAIANVLDVHIKEIVDFKY